MMETQSLIILLIVGLTSGILSGWWLKLMNLTAHSIKSPRQLRLLQILNRSICHDFY